MLTICEETFWSCKECEDSVLWVDDEIYPKGWTCTEEHGLICKKCSRSHKIPPQPQKQDWEDL